MHGFPNAVNSSIFKNYKAAVQRVYPWAVDGLTDGTGRASKSVTYNLIKYMHIIRFSFWCGGVIQFGCAFNVILFVLNIYLRRFRVHKNLQGSNAEAFKGDARDNEYVKSYSPPH